MGRTRTAQLGICRSAGCAGAARGPVELYDGPGRFCPDCGNYLQTYDGERRRWSLDETPPKPNAAPPEPTPRAAAAMPAEAVLPAAVPPAVPLQQRRAARPVVFAGIAATAVAAVFGVVAVARGTTAGGAATIGVCASSMTSHFTHDLVTAYGQRLGRSGAGFDVRSNDCAVDFAVAPGTESRTHSARSGIPIAYDALVAVVHPQNGLTTISPEQLRDILTGRITTWAPLNGRADRIDVVVPADGSDEARLLGATVLNGAQVGRGVRRLASTAEVVRNVSSPSGRNALGIVAFSGAVPAKVLALKDAPPPSVLSIGTQRYPLSVAVDAVLRDPRNGDVGALVRYAASAEAHAIAERDGLIAGTPK